MFRFKISYILKNWQIKKVDYNYKNLFFNKNILMTKKYTLLMMVSYLMLYGAVMGQNIIYFWNAEKTPPYGWTDRRVRMFCPAEITFQHNKADASSFGINFSVWNTWDFTSTPSVSRNSSIVKIDESNSSYSNVTWTGTIWGVFVSNNWAGTIGTFSFTPRNVPSITLFIDLWRLMKTDTVASGDTSISFNLITGVCTKDIIAPSFAWGKPLSTQNYAARNTIGDEPVWLTDSALFNFSPAIAWANRVAPWSITTILQAYSAWGTVNRPSNVHIIQNISSSDWIRFQIHEPNRSENQPWYNNDDMSTLNNYVANNNDDQVGVDKDTLQINLTVQGTTYTLNSWNDWIISWSTWSISTDITTTWRTAWLNPKTWDRKDRNYQVEIDTSSLDYGLEKLVTVAWSVSDRLWNIRTFNMQFNNPVAPWLTHVNPSPDSLEVLPRTDLSFIVRDNLAWVDKIESISIKYKLPWSSYTPLTLNGFSTGNVPPLRSRVLSDDISVFIGSGQYNNGQWFPIPTDTSTAEWTTIEVTVSARDKANNVGTNTYRFKTRRACGFYPWCTDPLKIFGLYSGTQELTDGVWYLPNALYVTGAITPEGSTVTYPYVEGDKLYCGLTNTDWFFGTTLEWNIQNGSIVWYTWAGRQSLYISWGNATIQWDETKNKWKMIITPNS